jgi:hypothetical protein
VLAKMVAGGQMVVVVPDAAGGASTGVTTAALAECAAAGELGGAWWKGRLGLLEEGRVEKDAMEKWMLGHQHLAVHLHISRLQHG